MKDGKPVILFVEDERLMLMAFERNFDDVAHVLLAENLSLAQQLFHEHRDELDLVIVDGHVDSNCLDTIPFVRMVRREGYAGPLLSAASDLRDQDEMMRRGCSHRVERKQDLTEVVRTILRDADKLGA